LEEEKKKRELRLLSMICLGVSTVSWALAELLSEWKPRNGSEEMVETA